MKVAKIITTSFAPRSIRKNTSLSGTPLGYFSHSQNFTTNEEILELIKYTLKLEDEINPGCSVDLIIVNNMTGWINGDNYLNSINNKKIHSGIVKILHRENIGRSFGGYNFAVEKYKGEYDFYIFTEDDILINKEKYAEIGIKEFRNCENCGFIAFQALSLKFKDNSLENSVHAHGGVGLTSYAVLEKVIKKYGKLAYSSNINNQDYESIIEHGEVAFTNRISKMGYNLIAISQKIKLYEYAYDRIRNITVPRYASITDILIYNLKQKLIKINIIKKLIRNIKQNTKLKKYNGK